MEVFAKLVLSHEGESFFGPGVRDLFLNIQSEGSVKAASEKMGLSYSKAWKMIRSVEKAIGAPTIARTQGGKSGGCAFLTQEGKDLLESYMRLEERSKESVSAIFREEFRTS